MNIIKKANEELEDFLKDNLNSYHKFRNYDYGIENRSNVSQISKYISHRILCEYEIIEKLKSIDKKKKFTDELIWRIYWRGYLESHRSIWTKYKNFKALKYDSSVLKAAVNGKTGINCFDSWIDELKHNNYLHNHSRMWFASIWIFTLNLPWQLGAITFMQHLFDGDSASNTLSWRWVAGMHTNNKPYIASKENIQKYTLNKFKNINFTISSNDYISNDYHLKSNEIPTIINKTKSKILIMFENDMNISNRSILFNSYMKVYILLNTVIENEFKLSKNVSLYKNNLIENIQELIPNSEIIKPDDLNTLLDNYEIVDVIYPGIGNNLDFINEYKNKKRININLIYREKDISTWKYADSGFFKFKKLFYKYNNI